MITAIISRIFHWFSIAESLNWLGSHWGNQREYLECSACQRRYEWIDVQCCAFCGGELYVVVPNGETLKLRWLCWKLDQKWLPQRMYHARPKPSYRYWQWLGREWLVRYKIGGIFD